MILEEYIDKGMFFKQILALAEKGESFRFYNGMIEVNGCVRFGTEGLHYTHDVIEDAIESAYSHPIAT